MTAILVLGDTHGDRGFTRDAIRWAAANGVTHIVQVGDFGFWPRMNSGQRFLHDVGKLAAELGIWFGFIDGNHEDHEYLDGMRGDSTETFITYSRKKYPLHYIQRGATWEWDGVRFGGFGGAFSIDRSSRTKFEGRYTCGWFPQEVPDISKISDLGKVDVLFTHDSPIVPPSLYQTGHYKIGIPESEQSQRTVYKAIMESKPDLVIHGHWHVYDRYKAVCATIQGLNCNPNSFHPSGLYEACVVFETGDRRLYTLRQWEYRDGQEQTEVNRGTGDGA